MNDTTNPPPDVLGIASVVTGVIALFGCMGTCVPYVGVLFMLMSMGFSVMGVILGSISVFQRRAAALPEGAAWAGALLNTAVLALWVLYWVVSMFLVLGILGVLVGIAVLDA